MFNRIKIVGCVVLMVTVGCAAPIAGIGDDATQGGSVGAQAAELRSEVTRWEGRRVRGVDANAIVRMRDWISKMESKDTSPEDAALYETAVKSQLEVLRTAEQRYGSAQENPEAPR